MPIEVSGSAPELVNDTVCTVESCPSTVPGKLKDVFPRVSVGGAAPVPLSATVCFPSVSIKVSVPVTGPVTVGVNSTLIWQSESTANAVVPHALLEIVKGAVIVRLVMGTAGAPLLLASTCSAAEVVPTST